MLNIINDLYQIFNCLDLLFALLILLKMINLDNGLTYGQQLKIIIMLSVGFMLMFTSYTSVQGILTKFYQSNGYQYYGRITLITVYTFFGLSTTYSSTIISYYGYKVVFVAGAFCFALLDASALIIYFTNNQFISLFVIITTSCLCGIGAGSIWVAANAYIGLICSKENVNQMYGIFEGIRSASIVIGFMLTVYIFKYYDGYTFFFILIPLSILSIITFLLLPNPPNNSDAYKKIGNQKELVGLAKIQRYFSLLSIKQNFQIYAFQTINSFPATLVSNFAFKIVDIALDAQVNESAEDYKNRLTYSFGIVLLSYGIGRCLISFSVKKITQNMDDFHFCNLSAYSNVLSIIVGGISLYLNSFMLCCVFSFLLGICYASTRSSANILIKQVFNNNLDMIGINYFLQSLSFIVNVILLLLLTKISLGLCILVYLIISLVIANLTRRISTIYQQKKEKQNRIELKDRVK